MQGVSFDQYGRDSFSGPQTLSSFAEGGSMSSGSDDSEYELTSRTYARSRLSFSSCCSFISKPVHPFSFPDYTFEGEEAHSSFARTTPISSSTRLLGLGNRSTGDGRASASSIDFTDMPEPSDRRTFGHPLTNVVEGSTCGFCSRPLSQRSPWGSRRMVWSGDMPVASVLSCWHVYHAECLERTAPKALNPDPPCPLCAKSRSKIGFPRLRPLGDEAGDCAEGAIHLLKQNNGVLLRNRSRIRKQMSLKGNSCIDQSGSTKRSGLCPPRVPHESVGYSSLSPSVIYNASF